MIESIYWIAKIVIALFMKKQQETYKTDYNNHLTKLRAIHLEAKIFCETTSAHGLVYFFGAISILERIFWILITMTMVVMGIVWVEALR